jgi:hypothetical protein
LPSHTIVAAAFFAILWLQNEPDLFSKSSTSIILMRLFSCEWRDSLPDMSPFDILLVIVHRMNSKAFKAYTTDWLKGHFLWEAHISWAERKNQKKR